MQERIKISISKLLRAEKRSNDFFEVMIGNLTLEELIALKLELSTRTLGTPLFGLKIWKEISHITKEAVLKFVYLVSSNEVSASTYLGIDKKTFRKTQITFSAFFTFCHNLVLNYGILEVQFLLNCCLSTFLNENT